MEVQQPPSKFVGYLLALMIMLDGSILCIVTSYVPNAWPFSWLMLIVFSTISYPLIAPRSPAFSPSLRKPIFAFFAGFLSFIAMMIFRLLFVKDYLSQLADEAIVFVPIALLLGGSGFFYYKATIEKKYLNIGIGVLCTIIATIYFFFFYLW
jgi:hypothetical protein